MKTNGYGASRLRGCMAVAAGFLLLMSGSAGAHTQSTAFLSLKEESVSLQGEWQVALRDLEDAVGIDNNEDGEITWGELRARRQAIFAYTLSRLQLHSGTNVGQIEATDLLVDNHADGVYAVVRFTVAGVSRKAPLQIDYRAIFDIDRKHRCLFRLQDGGSVQTALFSPETPIQFFDLRRASSGPVSFAAFVREGIWHIWSGYDHILFLLALLLPGVLRRRNGTWEPMPVAKTAVFAVLKIVTAFTVAHSITLSMATLGIVQLPARLIESGIAASVVVAAMNNLLPFYSEQGWLVAFGFGLLHGFGFANALRDLGLQHAQLAWTLLGFNLGVEFGQLVIVAVFLPLALSLRKLLFYPRLVLRLGSALIILIAGTWFTERVLDAKWLPF